MTRPQFRFLIKLLLYLVSSVKPFTLLLSLKVSKILSSGRGGRGAGINCEKKKRYLSSPCHSGPPDIWPRALPQRDEVKPAHRPCTRSPSRVDRSP